MNWLFTYSIITLFYSFQALFTPTINESKTFKIDETSVTTCENLTSVSTNSSMVGDDVTLQIIAPRQTQLSCTDTFKVETIDIALINLGTNPQTNVPLGMWMSNIGLRTDTFPGTIQPGDTVAYSFSTPVTLQEDLGGYWLAVWTDLAIDSVKSNDTLGTAVDMKQTLSITAPYHQDFENFTQCQTNGNCGTTVCNLSEGWVTATNNFVDNQDFRVHSGTTPTNNTGPTTDYYPGNAGGKYLYTEGNGCTWRRAHLISPCITLPANSDPQMTFMYHMYGNNIGWISVEVYDGNVWVEEVMPTIYWNQGDQWSKATVDLSRWVGQTINVRIQGITGGGSRSDLAVDDIRIQDFNTADDVSIKVTAPTGTAVSCGGSIVQVALTNEGVNPQSNFDVSYQRWDDVIVTETYTGTINKGETDVFVFSTPQTFATGMDTVRAWISLPNDAFVPNDTALSIFENLTPTSVTTGWTDNLETNTTCSTSNNCSITCDINDWINSRTDDIDWRTDFGGTPTGDSGPSIDHNPGNTIGKYLYLESSSCYEDTANLISPCMDIPANTTVEFSFWYHMRGRSVGELHVDLFDGIQWIEDIEPPVVGEQGDTWHKFSVNLSLWDGQKVNIRIRGITGDWYSSDISIDDFSLNVINDRPNADFSSNLEGNCIYGPITLIDDTDFPTDWIWSMSPNTYQFINGTNANSKNPEVLFTVPGYYEVQLISDNTNGRDTMIKSNFLVIHDIYDVPQIEDYTSPINGTFPPFDWSIDNPDQITTWSNRMVVGQNNQMTEVAYMDNFNYNAPDDNNLDRLNSITIELDGTTQPTLNFDVAYAKYDSQFTDSLRIDISTDCGVTFPFTVFQKGGADLATAPDNTMDFMPASALEWRTETVDLSDFKGETVVISFVNINSFGNNIYIDNFEVSDPLSPPTADFSYSDPACSNGVVFTNTSINPNTFTWNFGADASPATANTVGPHTVAYATLGQKTVELIVGNAFGIDTITYQINISELPTVGFNFNLGANGVVQFQNQSTNADSYLWDFGNGNTSSFPNPSHKFDAIANYNVVLYATNACGTVADSMTITPTNTFGINQNDLTTSVFPNPTKGQFTIKVDGIKSDFELHILDIQGRILQSHQYTSPNTSFEETLDLGIMPQGVYIVRIKTAEGIVENLRIVKAE